MLLAKRREWARQAVLVLSISLIRMVVLYSVGESDQSIILYTVKQPENKSQTTRYQMLVHASQVGWNIISPSHRYKRFHPRAPLIDKYSTEHNSWY